MKQKVADTINGFLDVPPGAGNYSASTAGGCGTVLEVPLGARVLAKHGHREHVAARVERAVELLPAYWAAWFGLADAREKLGRHGEAEEAYSRALRIRPRDGETRYRFGVFLARRERFTEAFAEYEKAVAAGYDGGEVRRNRGLALTKLAVDAAGNVDKERLRAAAAEFEKSLLFEPDNAETQEFLRQVRLGG